MSKRIIAIKIDQITIKEIIDTLIKSLSAVTITPEKIILVQDTLSTIEYFNSFNHRIALELTEGQQHNLCETIHLIKELLELQQTNTSDFSKYTNLEFLVDTLNDLFNKILK